MRRVDSGLGSPVSNTEFAHPTVQDIREAAARIGSVAHRTEVITCASLDRLTGSRAYLKCEQHQRSGSFKFRGAYNRLAQLTADEREAGVIAYSSGNHGAAVALAASIIETRATIVVPFGAADAKIAAITGYGAEIRFYDPDQEDRDAVAANISAASGAVVVPPYEDYEVIAGQGTLALELAQDLEAMDLILVPVGGGGLVAGVGTVVSCLWPDCRVIGVEPVSGDDTLRSLRSGRVVRNARLPDTIADGLRTWQPGDRTFAINKSIVDDVVTVSEESIVAAMRFCFEHMKTVVEPSGAVGVAALLAGGITAGGCQVAIVLSGGNISANRFSELVTRS